MDIKRRPPGKIMNVSMLDTLLQKDINLGEEDARFLDLFSKHISGEISAAFTRMSISRITGGFIDAEGRLKKETYDIQIMPAIKRVIQSGQRPCLYLYKSRLSLDHEFFCSDDEILLDAYKMLGINMVPVVLLDYEPTDLEESAVCVSYLNPHYSQYFITSFEPVHSAKILCFFGPKALEFSDVDTVVNKIEGEVNRLMEKVGNFHVVPDVEFHYHHTLVSILFRLQQSIKAIQFLAQQELFDQILIQLRAIYELSLNFYLDWLAPELMGPHLHRFSLISRNEWKELCEKEYKEFQGDWSDAALQKLKRSNNHLYEVISKVSEKAKLFPLWAKHNDLYRYLSQYAHQDFTLTAKYAHVLVSGGTVSPDKELIKYINVYLDIIASQVIFCIDSDVGERDHS